MWSKQFWKDTAERAIRTFAQALIAILGAGAVNILAVDWGQALSVAAGAALISVLTSIAASGFGDKGTPSLVTSPPVETPESLDAADVTITPRAGFVPDVVDADPDPADVRDRDEDGDA